MMTEQQSRDLARREESVSSVALDVVRRSEDRYERVLPEHVPVRQFVGSVEAALWSNPDLMAGAAASPAQTFKTLMRCATLGHIPGTEDFYLTPRKEKGKPSILGIEGYRGIIERMYRSGAVASVIVEVVHANDAFDFRLGTDDRPTHTPPGGSGVAGWFGASKDRGDMVGVYAYAILTTGATSKVVILNRDDVMEAKSKAAGANRADSPWRTDERAMWLKTAVRRLERWVPTSAEYRASLLRAQAQASNELRAAGVPVSAPQDVDPDTGEVHDGELVPEDEQGSPGEYDADAVAEAELADDDPWRDQPSTRK